MGAQMNLPAERSSPALTFLLMRFGRSGVAGSPGPRPIPGRPTLWSEIREIGPYRPQDRYSKLEICDKLHIFGQFPQRVALTLSALAP